MVKSGWRKKRKTFSVSRRVLLSVPLSELTHGFLHRHGARADKEKGAFERDAS